MSKFLKYIVGNGSAIRFSVNEAEIIDLINDTNDYIVRNFKIAEKIFKSLSEKGFYVGYSEMVEDHARVISEKLEDIKTFFILQVQEAFWPSNHANHANHVHAVKLASLCDIITSRIDEIVGGINLTRSTPEFEETWEDGECAARILKDIKAELLKRIDKLDSLFENL